MFPRRVPLLRGEQKYPSTQRERRNRLKTHTQPAAVRELFPPQCQQLYLKQIETELNTSKVARAHRENATPARRSADFITKDAETFCAPNVYSVVLTQRPPPNILQNDGTEHERLACKGRWPGAFNVTSYADASTPTCARKQASNRSPASSAHRRNENDTRGKSKKRERRGKVTARAWFEHEKEHPEKNTTVVACTGKLMPTLVRAN